VTLLPEVECELLRVARLPLPLPDDSPRGGRASARRRPSWSSAVLAAVAVFALAIGIAFMTTLHRARSGGPANRGPAQAAFPGAPRTQGNEGVVTGACPLAARNRYLPPRSGCVTAVRADLSGDGRPDLVIVYSLLSRQHASFSPPLRHLYIARRAFLEVVPAGGGAAVTAPIASRVCQRASHCSEVGSAAVLIDSVAHVNDDPGNELFMEVGRSSSGGTVVAYGLHDGKLVPAGPTLGYGGDSASRAGFNCLAGHPPRVVQRTYELVGPTIYDWWSETDLTYTWHGSHLEQLARRTSRHRGLPSGTEIQPGRGCTAGIGG
jgi:hypothetical protein